MCVAGCAPGRPRARAEVRVVELPPGAERAYAAVASRFDRTEAMDVVDFMQRYWRVSGNPGFNASIDHLRDRLRSAGFTDVPDGNTPAVWVEAYPKDVLQWGSVPHDEKLGAFGFKASGRAADRLRAALKHNDRLQVRVEIDSSFYTGPARSLVAEIPGRTRPAERIVIAAHVQEPGANDNASGCATLYGLEGQVIAAWLKWYGEALDSIATLPASGSTPSLLARIAAAKRSLELAPSAKKKAAHEGRP
jgi:hypothetical protein